MSLVDLQTALSKLWLNPQLAREFFAGETALEGLEPHEVKQESIELYGQLINIGRRELLASVYPYVKELLGKKFDSLVSDFVLEEKVSHFNFNKAAQGLSQFLARKEESYCKRFPFLAELALYEWLELEVMECNLEVASLPLPLAENLPAEEFALLNPVLNPNLRLGRFQYPINDIVAGLERKEKLPRRFKKQTSYVAIYRDLDDLNTHYLELGSLSWALLDKVRENPQVTMGELIQLAFSLNSDNPQIVEDFLSLLEDLQARQLILGVAP